MSKFKIITFLFIIILISCRLVYSQSIKETFELGKKAFYSDDFENANKLLAEILNRNSDSYEICLYKGLIYNIYFDYDKAITEFTSAIEIDGSKSDPYFNRALVYDKQEKYNYAVEDYTMAIKKNKKFLDAYNNRATDYERLKHYDKAINDYSNIVKLNPSDDIAYYNRGLLYVQLNRKEEAVEDFEEAIRIDSIWEKELRGKIDELNK